MPWVALIGLAFAVALMGRSAGAASQPAAPPPPPPPPPPGELPAGFARLSPGELALVRTLHPEAQAWLAATLAAAEAEGLTPKITSGRRTCAEQNAIYAQGRTKPGAIVTRARGCQSWHVHGRAVDLLLPAAQDADGYRRIGEMAERFGGKWGGRFGDPGHLEYHPGLTIEQVCPDPDRC